MSARGLILISWSTNLRQRSWMIQLWNFLHPRFQYGVFWKYTEWYFIFALIIDLIITSRCKNDLIWCHSYGRQKPPFPFLCDASHFHCNAFQKHCNVFYFHCNDLCFHCNALHFHCNALGFHYNALQWFVFPLQCFLKALQRSSFTLQCVAYPLQYFSKTLQCFAFPLHFHCNALHYHCNALAWANSTWRCTKWHIHI